MFMRNVLFSAAIALGAIAMPAAAQISLSIGVAPPPPRYELVPAPRAGYVWGPGYWRWEGERHVWSEGQWQPEVVGSIWIPERWVERDGRHHFEAGRWERR